MKVPKLFSSLKPFAITYISVIAFSNFVFVLFSQTVRDIIWSFFKDAGGIVILGMVFLFLLTFFVSFSLDLHKILFFDRFVADLV